MLSGVLGSLGNALMGLAGGGPAAAGAAPAPPEPKPAPRRAPRPAPGPFAVGAPVFVEVDSQATWLTGATVALANDDGTYDVILADDADHNGVPPELLHAAPDADLPGAMDRGGALKERGNGAFRAGDVGGAVAAYQEAVAHLEWAVLREAEAEPAAGAPLSVGARVRLRDRRSGTIACLSDTLADVMMDEGEDEDDVPLAELVPEPPEERVRAQRLLAACYLNLVRCLLRDEAARDVPLAAAAIPEEVVRLCGEALAHEGPEATCRYLRAKALLELSRAEDAVEDLVEAERLDPGNRQTKGLLRAARQKWREQVKSDRRLMAEMLKYVEGVQGDVTRSCEPRGPGGTGTGSPMESVSP